MQNLYKKYNSEEYQQSMSILLAGKTSNYDSLKNLKLVSALNRGGLWAITEDIQKTFIVAEKYFSLQVERKNIRYINTENIVKNLMSFSYIKDFFQNLFIEAELKPNSEVSKNTLQSIRQLFIRVRSFSYVKDIVEKRKLILKQSKTKALRKEISRASDKPIA